MNICEDCPIGLCNTKSKCLQGYGNPWSGNCIVVNNVDYSAYKKGDMKFSKQVELINNILLSSTGGLEQSDLSYFIVPLIRCNEYISYPVDKISLSKCIQLFKEDIIKYKFKNILLLDNAAKRFLNIDSITPYVDKIIQHNGINYCVNYKIKTKIAADNLRRWYFAVTNDNFFDYYPGYNSIIFAN